jgi:hypothetical protein
MHWIELIAFFTFALLSFAAMVEAILYVWSK